MPNGYKKPCPLSINAPAEMLESWAGYSEADADKELAFAIAAVDVNHAATLQWLACGLERRLVDLGYSNG